MHEGDEKNKAHMAPEKILMGLMKKAPTKIIAKTPRGRWTDMDPA